MQKLLAKINIFWDTIYASHSAPLPFSTCVACVSSVFVSGVWMHAKCHVWRGLRYLGLIPTLLNFCLPTETVGAEWLLLAPIPICQLKSISWADFVGAYSIFASQSAGADPVGTYSCFCSGLFLLGWFLSPSLPSAAQSCRIVKWGRFQMSWNVGQGACSGITKFIISETLAYLMALWLRNCVWKLGLLTVKVIQRVKLWNWSFDSAQACASSFWISRVAVVYFDQFTCPHMPENYDYPVPVLLPNGPWFSCLVD